MQTRGALTNGGMLCVDDYVQSKKNDKAWAEMLRQWFDHQGRSIGGDHARDFIADSGLMVTSNEIVCQNDPAVQARLLVFEFDKLQNTSGLSELQTFQELASALMPDFDTFLYEGKLDKEVIADCSNFLHQAVGEAVDRKIGMWAWLLYYMLLVSWMAQSVEGVVVTHSSLRNALQGTGIVKSNLRGFTPVLAHCVVVKRALRFPRSVTEQLLRLPLRQMQSVLCHQLCLPTGIRRIDAAAWHVE